MHCQSILLLSSTNADLYLIILNIFLNKNLKKNKDKSPKTLIEITLFKDGLKLYLVLYFAETFFLDFF